MSEWTAKGFRIYEQETGLQVALVDYKGHLKETAERNTRLIAHAPEMYELLQRHAFPLTTKYDNSTIFEETKQLLARIDGEQEVKE